MSTLPASIELPVVPHIRTHAPKAGRYTAYRDCLRLEFRFSCAFCLCHESELVEHGAEGSGLFAIEHYESQKSRIDLKDDYSNLFYACRYCNGKKLAESTRGPKGETLLNPCLAAWADHFHYDLVSFRFIPRTPDGEFTEGAYDLNAPRKIKTRETRFRAVSESLAVLKDTPPMIERLDGLLGLEGVDKAEVMSVIERLQSAISMARHDLERYTQIPADAPDSCRCKLV